MDLSETTGAAKGVAGTLYFVRELGEVKAGTKTPPTLKRQPVEEDRFARIMDQLTVSRHLLDLAAFMLVRTARETDAKALLQLLQRLDDETRFMMYEPGERMTTVQEHEELLKGLLAGGNSTVLLAEEDDQPVGFLEATGGAFRRNRHVVNLVLGVLGEHGGRGIGAALMQEAERWARGCGIHRLELTVMTHNAAAVALYEKAGFAIEGTRIQSMLVESSYVDEFYMVKLLV
jgi:RimJ/RimL family protein N-acetyltransferase